MSNAHEVMPPEGPDPWKNFNSLSGSASAVDAGSAWNSDTIDMSHHTGLIIRIKPGDAFTMAFPYQEGLGISVQRNSSAAGKKVQWAGGSQIGLFNNGPIMGEFDTERLANSLVANEETYFVFGGHHSLALLGMNDICISLKNQEGGSRTMEKIEYRRTGYQHYA